MNNQALPNPYNQFPPNQYNQVPPNQYNQVPPNQYNQVPPNQYNQIPPNQYNQVPPNQNAINPNVYRQPPPLNPNYNNVYNNRVNNMAAQQPLPQGLTITKLNYNRPSWFGGFLGKAQKHRLSGSCFYNTQELMRLNLTPHDLNMMFDQLHSRGVIIFYHLIVTIIPLLYLLTMVLRPFTLTIDGTLSSSHQNYSASSNQPFLSNLLQNIMYTCWIAFWVLVVPLYYLTLKAVEEFIMVQNQNSFRARGLKVTPVKLIGDGYIMIDAFKRIDALIIHRIN